MKRYNLILATIMLAVSSYAQNIFINEIDYKSSKSTRGLEVAAPTNTDLQGWEVEFYDAAGNLYHTEKLNGKVQGSGTYNAIWYPVAELHDQNDQSIWLNAPDGSTKQQINIGNTSNNSNNKVNIGVVQVDSTKGLQLIGTGLTMLDFLWTNVQLSSKGGINLNQIFIVPSPVISTTNTNNTIIINWATKTPLNNGNFYVERSDNGTDFYEVAAYTANGNNEYAFTDNDAQKGQYQYRVTWESNDFTQMATSEEVTATLLQLAEVSVYPNPVRANSNFTIQSNTQDEMKIVIFDALGKQVRVISFNGMTNVTPNNMGAGTYFYKIFSNETVLKSGKLVVTN